MKIKALSALRDHIFSRFSSSWPPLFFDDIPLKVFAHPRVGSQAAGLSGKP
jgi:hypothetical protein